MISSLRAVISASAVLAAALLVVGCATSPGEAEPRSSAAPDDTPASTAPVVDDDIEATWLDGGRMFAVVTWGSSTCAPVIEDTAADGQTVRVNLVDPPAGDDEAHPCTRDIAPRASIGALPESVDPTQDVELIVTIGDVTEDVDLDGNSAFGSGGSTEFLPSAGWFDDEGIVLLTWGSSSCQPVVDSVEPQSGGATVTFATTEGVCTSDMAPRATVLGVDEVDDDAPFTLTLVGDGLDGSVEVLRS